MGDHLVDAGFGSLGYVRIMLFCILFNDIKLDDVHNVSSRQGKFQLLLQQPLPFLCVGNGCIKFLDGDLDTLDPPDN